jgi:regulatory protein
VAVVSALKATRSGRVAVHLDGAYVCTVGEALLVRLGLFAGRSLTDEQVELLHSEAAAERALADAHRLLAHRPRARAELAARLVAKGHPQQAVQHALARLQERGLIDDAAFARAYVADRRRLHGWGTDRIARELARLGADPAAVQAALTDGAGGGEEEELQRALQLLSKQRPSAPPQAAKRRAYQLLLRRGFSTTVAYAAVRRWAAETRLDADDPR